VDVYSNLVREVPRKHDAAQMVPVIRGGINVNAVQNISYVYTLINSFG